MTLSAPTSQRGPVDPTVLAAVLREVKGAFDPILGGILVAGVDGLVLSAVTCGVQVETLGVMAAAVAGISSQIAAQAEVGEAGTCLFEGSTGHVAVFPLQPAMVLVVISKGEVSTGRFILAARGVLFRLREVVEEGAGAEAASGAAAEGPAPQVFEPVNRVPNVRFELE